MEKIVHQATTEARPRRRGPDLRKREARSKDPTVMRQLDGVAKRLKETRTKAGLSTRALAARARLSRGTVHAVESGKTARVELCTVLCLADALGVSRAWLAFGEDDRNSVTNSA